MESNEEVNGKARRISLKWKWAIGTGLGVLVIFSLFSFFIFKNITGSLFEQERSKVDSTMNQVAARFQSADRINADTSDILQPDLRKDFNQNPNNLYTNSLFASLSRQDISVSIYNLDGKRYFASRPDSIPFLKVEQRDVSVKHVKKGSFLVGRLPLMNKQNQQIGYLQVVDSMAEYESNFQRLIWVFSLSTLLVFIVISLFGYLLASYLLRPIKALNRTMIELGDDPQTDARIPELHQNDELADLTREFNTMIDRMQKYINQQSQFVEDVSHELRTPVAVIEGHLKMLKRWGKDDPQVLEESINASLEESQRMKSLVSEMLTLTRADQIEINYANETTDISKVVNQVYNDFKMIHPDFKFILDNDIYRDPIVQIYRNHFEQVLIILLDNAVKYSTKRKEIHISASRTSQMVEVAVQDFGEGISKENVEQVFNRFYRVDKSRSRDQGGNGLGLSIAQRLIEEYHGNISLESSVGYGSIFRIQLPILRDNETSGHNKKAVN